MQTGMSITIDMRDVGLEVGGQIAEPTGRRQPVDLEIAHPFQAIRRCASVAPEWRWLPVVAGPKTRGPIAASRTLTPRRHIPEASSREYSQTPPTASVHHLSPFGRRPGISRYASTAESRSSSGRGGG